MLNNIGAEIYASWDDARKRLEIERLVKAYQGGLGIVIVCQMAEAIAGSRSDAKRHLSALMPLADRLDAVSSATKEHKEARRLVRALLT